MTYASHVWLDPVDGMPQSAWGVTKGTYRITRGQLVRTDPEPLRHDLRNEAATPRWPPGSDYWPHKLASDVVVLGKAFGPNGREIMERQVSVRVGQRTKRVQVFGDRTASWKDGEQPRFGAPERFTELDLVYTNAYGGIDPRVEADAPRTLGEAIRFEADHPGAYPRNQSGKGFVVLDVPRQELDLPNLEDPERLLTPATLVTGRLEDWYRQPLSWFLDWQYPAMFPRAAYVGLEPWHPMPTNVGVDLEEVRRQLMPAEWREMAGDLVKLRPVPPIFYQEASLGMVFSDLSEGTPIEIVGMHPEHDRLTFALPPFPVLAVDVEGDRQPVPARLLHVVITPHEEKVEITWAGIRERMPRSFFPGIHGHIPITLFVDGTGVPFETPEPIYEQLKRAEHEAGIELRPTLRRPGEPGYSEVRGALLPEGRADRARDQVAFADAPLHGRIDPLAGRLLLEETDWVLPGSVPFAFRRFYSSSMAWRAGALGLGWSHCLEQSVWEQDGWILYRTEDGREVGIPMPGGQLGIGGRVHHPSLGVTVFKVASDAYEVRHARGERFGFTRVAESVSTGPERARLSRIWASDGAILEVRYDTHGRLDRLVLPSGQDVRFEHDERGRLTRVFAPTRDGSERAVAARYTLDASGQLREASDALNRTTTYRYQARLLTQRKLPSGLVQRFVYDAQGASARCVGEKWGEDEKEREVFFNPEERVVGLGDANGGSFSSRVNASYFVDRALDYFANELTRSYDETSGLLSSQNTKDGETTWLYDAGWHLADVSAPDEGSVALEHDGAGRLEMLTDPDGHAQRWAWDPTGLLTAVVDSGGASTVYGYDGDGPLASILTPGEVRITIERDPQTKAAIAVNGPTGPRRATRDALSRVIGVADELGHKTSVRYDPCGHVAQLDLPVGLVRVFESDHEGRVTRVQDGASAIAIERDGLGQVAHIDEGGGTGPRLHRDAEGRVTMVESEAFDFWELTRDAAGRVIEESGYGGEEHSVLRDHRGLVKRAMCDRVRAQVKRDAAGRPIELEHADGSFQRLAWTKGGRLARAQQADRVTSFERDGRGLVTTETADEHRVTSRYDARGDRVAIDSSLGLAVRIERDVFGNAMSILATKGEQRFELRFDRDAAGRETRRHLPGGLALRWKRDEIGRPGQRAVMFGDRELATVGYQWVGLDRLVRVEDSQRGARDHRHDERGRLVRVGGLVRALDDVGNVYRSEAKDDLRYADGRLVESYGTEYTYDDSGRRIAKKSPIGEERRYRWDGLGRLVEVWLADDDRVAYDYDGLGRMVARRREKRVVIEGLDEPVWEPARETRFVWDGLTILHEIDGGRVSTWLWEAGRLVGKLDDTGGYAVLTDPLGSVTELVDAHGNLSLRGSLELFGLLELDNAQTACPWRFPGHWEDPDTGLQHTWQRVYDPETGAYLTESPLGIAGGPNLYAYVQDPLSHASPLGLGRGYAALLGELKSERLDAELVERFVTALDRGDGAAGPRERFDREAARLRLPDPDAIFFGPWEAYRPSRRLPPPTSSFTSLPETAGLSGR